MCMNGYFAYSERLAMTSIWSLQTCSTVFWTSFKHLQTWLDKGHCHFELSPSVNISIRVSSSACGSSEDLSMSLALEAIISCHDGATASFAPPALLNISRLGFRHYLATCEPNGSDFQAQTSQNWESKSQPMPNFTTSGKKTICSPGNW